VLGEHLSHALFLSLSLSFPLETSPKASFCTKIALKLLNRHNQTLDQAAQGSGGVAIPGGVQKTCGCGTSGHGLSGMVVLG